MVGAPAVTVVGSLNLDLVVGVERLPGRGETVVGTSAATGPGGKGANQAAAAAALCPAVAMVGRVGADGAGTALLDDLLRRGVDVAAVTRTSGAVTGTATVAVEDGTGENLIVVAAGANADVSAADVRIDRVRDATVVLLQLEIPLPAVVAAAEYASGRTVLNPAPARALPPELLEVVDVLVPNEGELAELAGVPSAQRSVDELVALARTVTAGDVIVTMGVRGALVIPAGGDATHLSAPRVDAIDTTGAGDCFCGALCVALAREDALVAASAFAVTAAALSTTAAGARGRLPDEAAVRALSGHVDETR